MCAQRSGISDRTVSTVRTTASSKVATSSSSEETVVMGSKPFYPEVQVRHVDTPSKFYVMELSRKDSLNE